MRLLVLLTSALAVAGLLSACGGGGESEEDDAAQQGAKTEEQEQTEEAMSSKDKTKNKANASQEPRKEQTSSVSESKSKSQSQINKNYGSREELAERFGLPSNEEEAYHSSADRTVRQYSSDIKQAQRGLIELQQAFETRRIPPDKPWSTPATLERDALDDIEKLTASPGLFENWNEQVPTRYESCHLLMLQTYEKGLEAVEAFLDYKDDYERATLENGLDLSKDAEALAHDAQGCLGER